LAREQERLIEQNLQQLLQSEVNSANNGSSEEEQLDDRGVDHIQANQAFGLAFN